MERIGRKREEACGDAPGGAGGGTYGPLGPTILPCAEGAALEGVRGDGELSGDAKKGKNLRG